MQEVPLTAGPAVPENRPSSSSSGGISGEILSLVENGSFPSLLRALDLIRSRNLGETEFGRTMNAVAIALLQKVYPSLQNQYPVPAPPQTH
ncbi:MAG: hypothetical protein LBH57_09905, partial [Treponema sp.]|nr:hypothetical protein [Treponema sp.]